MIHATGSEPIGDGMGNGNARCWRQNPPGSPRQRMEPSKIGYAPGSYAQCGWTLGATEWARAVIGKPG